MRVRQKQAVQRGQGRQREFDGGDICTKTGRPVVDVLQRKHPDMCVPPVENPTCTAFEEYREVL